MRLNLFVFYIVIFILNAAHNVIASEITAYELIYNEQEPGTDIYRVRFVISDKYIRIDNDVNEEGEGGYIIYDDHKRKIHSVSNFDKTILVIPHYEHKQPEIEKQVEINYSALTDAPTISGKTVYSYTVHAESEKCMDIQLVPGLLPGISKILKAYQGVVAGQQVKVLKTTPEEYQTTCFLYDQVYNDGTYYEKGLPIQEWHSNGKLRVLDSYKEIKVDSTLYDLPDGYREYSLD